MTLSPTSWGRLTATANIVGNDGHHVASVTFDANESKRGREFLVWLAAKFAEETIGQPLPPEEPDDFYKAVHGD